MDPITALSVASSIVQLVDFTQDLFRSSYEIYKSTSGRSEANVDLQSITASLKTLTTDLTQSVERATSDTGKEPSKNDKELLELSKSCSGVAAKLIAALDQLTAQKTHNIWDSFSLALRTIWSNKQVKSLNAKLVQYRVQISIHINASVREQVARLQADQSSHGQLISTSLQATQDLSQKILKQMQQNAKWQAQVIEAIHRSSINSEQRTRDAESGDFKWITTHDHFFSGYGERFGREVLARLHYIEMESRAESVAEAYDETFQWIFSPAQTTDQKWSNFTQFLESDQSLYWVTGKPGSGKSTLMKLIKNDRRTAPYLKKWAGSKKLYTSGFYFWCSGGNEIQMTQEGLLRTLIQNALSEFPYLGPLMFPKRLETFVIFGDGVVWGEPLSLTELLSAFKLFVHEATKTHKIFLLLDGLDEFNGTYSQQVKLIEFIQSLASSDVKFCVSSRPWNVFEDAFNARPSLRVEDLTYKDIHHYCSANLSKNLGFNALKRGDLAAASELVDNVSMKACGVFLWVTLVVESLLEGLTDGERLSDLQKRLDSLPSDLEDLFWRILRSVDFERISQIFQIVQVSPNSISILRLSYADEDNPDFLFNLPIKPLPRTAIDSRAELMRRRLNACCKGLLEPQGYDGFSKTDPQAIVAYLHRTVRDFIKKPDIWAELLSATGAAFDPRKRVSVAHASRLKVLPTNSLNSVVLEEYASHMRDAKNFWEEVVGCIQTIAYYGPDKKPQETSLRILEEVKNTVDQIVTRGVSNYDSGNVPVNYGHCSTVIGGTTTIRSFLHLTVKLQIYPYVNVHVDDVQGPDRAKKLSLLLQVALTDYAFTTYGRVFNSPSLPIIETLLKYGATFDGHDVWTQVIKTSPHNTDLSLLLLRYGADPFVPQLGDNSRLLFADEVRELAKAKREEAIKNGRAPRRMEKTLGSSKILEVKAPSAWSRLRSRYSSSKGERDDL
ncbi:hypothetical protein N431DRAFT_452364 [Stipitochalara longipes BDJ]|nr:hypothetical protein N431DRAFT_452364 [Stipitochalara longipes BDJ]